MDCGPTLALPSHSVLSRCPHSIVNSFLPHSQHTAASIMALTFTIPFTKKRVMASLLASQTHQRTTMTMVAGTVTTQ